MKKSTASSQRGGQLTPKRKRTSASPKQYSHLFRVPGARVDPSAATVPLTEEDFKEVPILPPGSFRRVGSITTWKFRKPLKKQLTIRLDQNVYDWLKSKGPGYQSLLNGILREVMLAEQH